MTELINALVASYGWPSLLAAIATFYVGGVVKGGLGFGMPLVTISVLPLFLPIDLALAANMAVLMFTNTYQFIRAGRMLETVRRFWMLLVGLAIGVPIGTRMMTGISPEMLTMAVGVFIVIFVILTVTNPKIAISREREPLYASGTGLVVGVLGPLTSTPGPLFASFLLGTGVDRRMMLSGFGLFLIVLSTLTSGSYWIVGVLDAPRFLFSVACVPGVIAGMWCGDQLAGRLSAERFRNLLMAVLFGLGVYMVVRSL